MFLLELWFLLRSLTLLLILPMQEWRLLQHTIQYPLLITHIIFAFVALITGFLQLIDRIRVEKPSIHRYLGRAYILSVFISGLLALIVVFYIESFTKSLAFLALTIVWLVTTWKGYRSAVTLVAVSARLLVPLLLLAYSALNGFTLSGGRERMVAEVLNVNIWVGLLVNFVIVEWYILKKNDKKAVA